MAKASIPKGTRDFGPGQMAGRNHIFSVLRGIFERYGYQPLETPAMEKLETLTGKYGEEGDRLIFKILSRGEKLKRGIEKLCADKEVKAGYLSDEALRYDLTVPFARYVVQHRNELAFPFKRYQIQPVWRADRPQKGRYREFYQCDIDVIGSDSLLNEVELVGLMTEAFTSLGLPGVIIRVNNRKILEGVAEKYGLEDKFTDITVAIDKLDKIGRAGVLDELSAKGISGEQAEGILNILEGKPDLDRIAEELAGSETGMKGVEELRFILERSEAGNVEVDLSLARGLNYYTGAIFEVVHPDFPSSICGGGRYDNLTGIFGLPGVSGVGVSFGADRIYDLMLDKDLFAGKGRQGTDLLFVNFGEREADYVLRALPAIRKEGISAELYPDSVKMKKQMKYANDKGVRFVALAGADEMAKGVFTLKNMETGEQSLVTLEELIGAIND